MEVYDWSFLNYVNSLHGWM